jgi:hypothetical protein
MEYMQLSQQYRDDAIAEAMHGREREHFHYALDHANFTEMLKTLPDGDYKTMIAKRLQETASRMAEVDLIHSALAAQVVDQTAHNAAVVRTTDKRDAAEAAQLTVR